MIAVDPLVQQVAAVSVGVVGGEPMLDLCYEEDSRADTDMNVVMTAGGEYIEVQATAEAAPFSDANFLRLLELARIGTTALIAAQNEALAR